MKHSLCLLVLGAILAGAQAQATITSFNADGVPHADSEGFAYSLKGIQKAINDKCQSLSDDETLAVSHVDKIDDGAISVLVGAAEVPRDPSCPEDMPCNVPRYQGGHYEVTGYMPSLALTLVRTGADGESYQVEVTSHWEPTDEPYDIVVATLKAPECGGSKTVSF